MYCSMGNMNKPRKSQFIDQTGFAPQKHPAESGVVVHFRHDARQLFGTDAFYEGIPQDRHAFGHVLGGGFGNVYPTLVNENVTGLRRLGQGLELP